jgi:hypothetical protein
LPRVDLILFAKSANAMEVLTSACFSRYILSERPKIENLGEISIFGGCLVKFPTNLTLGPMPGQISDKRDENLFRHFGGSGF